MKRMLKECQIKFISDMLHAAVQLVIMNYVYYSDVINVDHYACEHLN